MQTPRKAAVAVFMDCLLRFLAGTSTAEQLWQKCNREQKFVELTLRKPFFLFSRRIFGFYKPFGHKLAELQALRASRIHLAGNAAEMNPKREAGTDTGEQEIKVAQDQNKWFRSFASQADREREEMFCNHYRGIGIQAVAAAKCLRNNQSPTAGTDRAITANTAKKQN